VSESVSQSVVVVKTVLLQLKAKN